MSQFTTKLITRPLDRDELATRGWSLGWELQRGFIYDLGRRGGGDTIRLKKGLWSNGASVPRFLWPFCHPCDADIGKAAWVHDFLYWDQQYSKILSDALLWDGMITLGSPAWKARICFDAVHYFGKAAWKQSQVDARARDAAVVLPYPNMIDGEGKRP
jgi:hypothetical protein